MSIEEIHALIAHAISDPGAFTPRGQNYEEPIIAWVARAVFKALTEKGIIKP